MTNPQIENGVNLLKFSRSTLMVLIDQIPEDKLCYQPFPGSNHALWILGHLTVDDNGYLTALAGKPSKIPAEWDQLFGMGSTPTSALSRYPPFNQLRDLSQQCREELIGWFQGMTDEKLAEPLPPEHGPFAANYGALISAIAWHEGIHEGQLTVVRKSLGIKPAFG